MVIDWNSIKALAASQPYNLAVVAERIQERDAADFSTGLRIKDTAHSLLERAASDASMPWVRLVMGCYSQFEHMDRDVWVLAINYASVARNFPHLQLAANLMQ